MALTLQFCTKIGPSTASRFSPSTVGIFSTGNVVLPPDGRHDVAHQIWTAPRPDGEKGDWQGEQKLLCQMNQMAIAIRPSNASSQNAKL